MMHRVRLAVLLLVCVLFVNHAFAAVDIPDETTVIGEQAFFGDTSITEASLPEGLLRIEKQAFAGTSLSSVLLPMSLQYFAPDAFDGCPDGFTVQVYPDSEALRLCESYGIPYTVKPASACDVGISMPTEALERWNRDGHQMQSLLTGSGYSVNLSFAENSVDLQIAQIEAMIDGGCRVLIIASIIGDALSSVLEKAKAQGVSVIAYDRLLLDTDALSYYVTFDNYRVGVIQANYVKNALKLDTASGPFYLEFTAGDPGDTNGYYFYQGAIDTLQPYIDAGSLVVASGQTSFESVATNYWSSGNAQTRAESILSGYYANGQKLDAWLCSNDSTAYGVINALESSYDTDRFGWPVITGQDCDIGNVRFIIAGKQSMSAFRATSTLAAQTAKMAKQIMTGQAVDVNDNLTYHNGVGYVNSYLCDAICVDKNNYREILIDTGFYSEEDLR